MNNIKFLGKLVLTYLASLIINLLTLFLLIVPAGIIFGSRDSFPVIIIGLLLAFFYPGCLCVFVYLPILLLDKKKEGLEWHVLLKRYLPFVVLVLALICILFAVTHTFSGPLGYSYIYIYLVSMISLFVFCRMIAPSKD